MSSSSAFATRSPQGARPLPPAHDTAAAACAPPPCRRRRLLAARTRAPPPPAASAPDLDALLGGLQAPEIEADLADVQAAAGAVFDAAGVARTFRNDGAALLALREGAALVDRSHWGRLRLAGPERAAFLAGQSTADVVALTPGQGCETVLVDAQARCIDVATVLAQGEGLLLLLSPGTSAAVRARLERVIFPADRVELSDIAPRTAMFSLLGPGADALLAALKAGALVGAPRGAHAVLGFAGRPVLAAVGGGLDGLAPGYTLVADESVAAELWHTLARGATPMGAAAFEVARVLGGRPAPGAELTEEFNPLEAGLYAAVSLAKGCYIGQETLAKVHGRGALRRQLWGLDLAAPAAVGDAVFLAAELAADTGAKAIGTITSYVDAPDGRHAALAYLRCRRGGEAIELEGVAVVVDGSAGRVMALPCATRAFEDDAGPAGGGGAEAEAAAAAAAAEAEAVEEARRAEKLAAMQARLAAWQAEQDGED
jgi:folate-binding protein YgfZ